MIADDDGEDVGADDVMLVMSMVMLKDGVS